MGTAHRLSVALLYDEGVHLTTSDLTEQIPPVDIDPDALALLDSSVLRVGAPLTCGIFFSEANEAVGKHTPITHAVRDRAGHDAFGVGWGVIVSNRRWSTRPSVNHPQAGIFALGTGSRAYLEFDLSPGRDGRELVAGFLPELWAQVAPDDAPVATAGFNQNLIGPDGFAMPATQHDALLWIAGSAYDVVFDVSRDAIGTLAGLAVVADETSSWPYQRDRDLTGFVDGSENPSLVDAPDVAVIGPGKPGAGGSILLLQKWVHRTADWQSLSVADSRLVCVTRSRDTRRHSVARTTLCRVSSACATIPNSADHGSRLCWRSLWS